MLFECTHKPESVDKNILVLLLLIQITKKLYQAMRPDKVHCSVCIGTIPEGVYAVETAYKATFSQHVTHKKSNNKVFH
jgi:hypothetical protein